MNKSKLFSIIPGIIALVVGFIAIAFFIIKLLWAWTIPDLFPGAVEQGLVAAEISWLTAFKLAIFFAILTSASKGSSNSN